MLTIARSAPRAGRAPAPRRLEREPGNLDEDSHPRIGPGCRLDGDPLHVVSSDHDLRNEDGWEGAVGAFEEYQADLHSGVLIECVSYNTIAFPQPIVAIAIDPANVFDCDCSNVDCVPVPFPLTVSIDGEDFALPFGADFFGASSNGPLSSLVIRATDPIQGEYFIPSLDNISFVAVPEPSAGALTASGLLLLAGGRRFARRPARARS